jgi:hypothetical protein
MKAAKIPVLKNSRFFIFFTLFVRYVEGEKRRREPPKKRKQIFLRNKLLLGLQVEIPVKLTISPLMGSGKHS